MALIKCAECGKEISDKATQCIHCGCPIDRKIICSECGKEINTNETVCKNCGYEISNNNFNCKTYNQLSSQEKKQVGYEMKKNHIYPLSIYVGYLFIFIEIFWFIFPHKMQISLIIFFGIVFMGVGIIFLLIGNKEIVNYYNKNIANKTNKK